MHTLSLDSHILNLLPYPVILISSKEEILFANHIFLANFLDGIALSDVETIDIQGLPEELKAFIRRTLTSEGSLTDIIKVILDQRRFFQAHGSLVPEKDQILISLVDITALKRLEEIRRDFVANVSHELRTPITSIQGSTETLLDGAMKDPETSEKFIQMISRHASRLQNIIQGLLTLSRLENESRKEISTEPKDLHEIIEDAIEACQSKAISKKVNLIQDKSIPAPAAVNSHLLQQAFTNLIDNAVNACRENDSITIDVVDKDSSYSITIVDTGIGIEKEHISRIFERFYTVDHARTGGRSGLGLAIVKHIVRAHGGTIEVKSIPGNGATFTMMLPKV